MGDKNWATVREASEHYKVSRQRIHALIKRGSFGEPTSINLGSRRLLLVRYPYQWIRKKSVGRPKKEVK